MKANEFVCAICLGIFEKGQTEKEAEETLEKNFPGTSKEECDLVCDDCYNDVMRTIYKRERKGEA